MSFKLARAKSQSIPRVKVKALAAAQVFKMGALLLVDANDNYAECGANPAAIAAVSQTAAGPSTEIGNHFGKEEFPPGYAQGIAVQDEVEFRARYIGAPPANAGASYDVIRDSDSFWKVNFGSSANARVKLLRLLNQSPENVPECIVTVLAANVQVI